MDVEDIKFLIPCQFNKNTDSLNDLSSLAFANGASNAIMCFFKDQNTCFVPYWDLDELYKKWRVVYTEYVFDSGIENKIPFSDPSAHLSSVLERIKDLADKIKCPNFADIFSDAKQRITDISEDDIKSDFYMLPEKNLRLFQAACKAFVFGGMGSWNDEPPASAFEYKLMEEYTKLSSELYQNIILAILYGANEW